MVFEVGKFYKHIRTGQCFAILSEEETITLGKTVIAKVGRGCQTVRFMSNNSDDTTNYHEMTKEEWISKFPIPEGDA